MQTILQAETYNSTIFERLLHNFIEIKNNLEQFFIN